jgi:hypothetical protein
VWTVRPVSLEELTLAYMSTPTADAMSASPASQEISA